MRIVVILALIAALALPAAACGRKGKPEAPPGSDFPRTYPSR
jgi:predicted small lipoprotein YifL